jgi:hypothetical protein
MFLTRAMSAEVPESDWLGVMLGEFIWMDLLSVLRAVYRAIPDGDTDPAMGRSNRE